MLTEVQQTAMQTVRDKIEAFQQWKQGREESVIDKVDNSGEDKGFNKDNGQRGDNEQADEEEVDKGFEDGVSNKEVKWMGQIQ